MKKLFLLVILFTTVVVQAQKLKPSQFNRGVMTMAHFNYNTEKIEETLEIMQIRKMTIYSNGDIEIYYNADDGNFQEYFTYNGQTSDKTDIYYDHAGIRYRLVFDNESNNYFIGFYRIKYKIQMQGLP